MEKNKIRVHLILPGGGVRGSFKEVLYVLMNYFKIVLNLLK